MNNTTSRLEYAKMILQKVSFDARLFRKELKKSLSWVSHEEANALKEWVVANYKHLSGDTLTVC